MSFSRLVDVMDRCARRTWDDRARAQRLSVPFGETTVTERNMLDVAQCVSTRGGAPRIVPISQLDEKKVGADFEIWTRVDHRAWLGFSIQAKLSELRPTSVSIPHLGYPGAQPRFQYDTLIAHAQSVCSFPLHLFYNGWDAIAGRTMPYDAFTGGSKKQYGCAAIDTRVMKTLRERQGQPNTNKLEDFAPSTFPWADLFRVHALPPLTAAVAQHRAVRDSGQGRIDDLLEVAVRLATAGGSPCPHAPAAGPGGPSEPRGGGGAQGAGGSGPGGGSGAGSKDHDPESRMPEEVSTGPDPESRTSAEGEGGDVRDDLGPDEMFARRLPGYVTEAQALWAANPELTELPSAPGLPAYAVLLSELE